MPSAGLDDFGEIKIALLCRDSNPRMSIPHQVAMLSALSQLKFKRDVIKKKKFATEIADSLVNSIDLERSKYVAGIMPCLWLLILCME